MAVESNHQHFVAGTRCDEGVRGKPEGVQGAPCHTPDHGVRLPVDGGRGCLPESVSAGPCPGVCLTAGGCCPGQSTAGLCDVLFDDVSFFWPFFSAPQPLPRSCSSS